MRQVGIIILILAALFLMIVSGCMSENKLKEAESMTQQTNSTYKKISPEVAQKRLKAEKDIILLDVRTKEEYSEKHIPGSKLIPLDVLEREAPSQIKDKDATIFVYCRSGRRSAEGAGILAKLGYSNIYDIGGIIDWPYDTEAGD